MRLVDGGWLVVHGKDVKVMKLLKLLVVSWFVNGHFEVLTGFCSGRSQWRSQSEVTRCCKEDEDEY